MKVPSGNELLDPLYILKDQLDLHSGDHIADLGCGSVGHFVIQSAHLVGSSGYVHGVDILKNVIVGLGSRIQTEGLTNVGLHWSNLEKFGALKINDQSLDAVLLINVLFQNKDRETIVKEALRLLKPEGKLLIIDWAPGRFPMGPEPQQKIDPEQIRSLGKQLDLETEKTFEAGKYHYGFIFKKPAK